MVLEKTFESLLDYKENQPVHSEGDRSWVFIGRADAKAETPILWPRHAKSIQPVHSEGDKSWMFIGRTDAKAETPILWPPHAKS